MAKSSEIQAHTDKYALVGALDPDTGEIKAVQMGDATVLGLATQLYVWNTSTLVWDKMVQPTIETGNIFVAVDDLEQYTLDQLFHYKMANFDDASDPVYVGYLDKDGNYYIEKTTLSTGVVEYSKGTSAYATAWTNRATESYNSFDTEF